MKKIRKKEQNIFYEKITRLLQQARESVVQTVNRTMVYTYYQIGMLIVEEEQTGKKRAEYGKSLLQDLSKRLVAEFGRGFSETNLKQMRQFYLTYSNRQTLSDDFDGKKDKLTTKLSALKNTNFNLSWSHYLVLMRIENEKERSFYEIEAINNNWSLRELKRQFNAALYERLALSRDKKGIKKLSENGQIIEKPEDALKDPYILEFVGLPEETRYSESLLERKIIDKLENFLLELGKGFTFAGRQVRFSFDDEHYRIDLVFYNRLLQCFVLIDLKIGKLTHQDLGQMQMYVNYYDRYIKNENENKTIGIVLCKDKNNALVEISLPEDNEQIFASKYQTVLPSKKELKALIENKKN